MIINLVRNNDDKFNSVNLICFLFLQLGYILYIYIFGIFYFTSNYIIICYFYKNMKIITFS